MSNDDNNIFMPLLLTVIVILVIVFSVIQIANKITIPFNPFKSLSVGGIYEVTKASKNLPVSTTPDETITKKQMVKLRTLLQEGQLEMLNDILEEYQNLFEDDTHYEYVVCDAYNAFNLTGSSYEAFFKEWITTYPDNYQPHLAIAKYYYARGWESRGYKWAKDTPEEQFEKMRYYFSEAEKNLNIALQMNPKLIVAYTMLIGIANASKGDNEENAVIEKAIALFPDSYIMMDTIQWAKEPRWGGSYAIMEEIAKQSEKYWDINPKLSALYGSIYYDQAMNFRRNLKYNKAIDLFTKAISFGDTWQSYNERAQTYYLRKEYDLALDDINRSIELRPTKNAAYRLRAKIYYAKEDYINSLENLQATEAIRPGDPKTVKWKNWASNDLLGKGNKLYKTDLRSAIDNYNLSVEFDDNNFKTYYWRGTAFAKLGDFESALSDLERAIEINPHHFESYRMIDYIYVQDRQWDTIIEYWDQFLELEPDHAKAYLERAGTYYHKKDFKNALMDLEKSCELGNQEACKRYKQFKGKI